MIRREGLQSEVAQALERSRVVALLGPRQCGKTTLARQLVPVESRNYFDLEDPLNVAPLADPMTVLRPLSGIVVIDEIQHQPELFPILRVLADRQPLPARFLILGSASPDLVRHASESLAGRIETINMSGFSIEELGAAQSPVHWLRGGFPPSFLAATDAHSLRWRSSFIQTFLQRDVPLLGYDISAEVLRRFWTMLAHYHGGIWNGAELAGSLGVSQPTVRRYLDLLTGFFMVRQLLPWHENLKKRQVKSPKIYVRDSGLLHALLRIRDDGELMEHPKLGASWEGYAIEESLKALEPDEAYFWATHERAELDLLLLKDGKRIGVEAKRMDAPRLTKSMQIAMDDLKLDRLIVLYPGDREYPLSDRVNVHPISVLASPDKLT